MNALSHLLLAAADTGTFWLPPQASEQAADVDWLFWFIMWVCIFFFVLIIGFAAYFAWRYRRLTPGQAPLPSPEHHTPLEVFWSLVPLVLAVYIFYVGFDGFMTMNVPPKNAYTIDVIGQKWSWSFRYQSGAFADDGNLHVPPGEPVKLIMSSQDVLHAFFIPNFRVKQDLVPGRFTTLWFTAKKPAGDAPEEHHMTCAEYCGERHSAMSAKVVVHPTRESFDKWLDEQGKFTPSVEIGEKLYKQLCLSCHNIDGAQGQGPNWRELAKWLVNGEARPLADNNSVTVDEEYIRESIMEPAAKLAAGFQPVMPTFKGQLKADHISAITLYIKSLAQ